MNQSKQGTAFIKSSLRPVILLVSIILLASCGAKYITNYKPIAPVSNAQYCQTNTIGKVKTLTPLEIKLLEDKNRVSDTKTIDLMLRKAAYEIVATSDSVKQCEKVFQQGETMFFSSIKRSQQSLAQVGNFNPKRDPDLLRVQEQITDLWREDQSARATMVEFAFGENKDSTFWANRLASAQTIRADMASTQYIEQLIETYDWIDQRRFGGEVSAHAWILIQHADDRLDLQTKVLKRMEPYFKNGGIRPSNYAYLWDRVAVNSGQLQRYGTQPDWECKQGQLELQPIEDLSKANSLRAELGMNSVEAGLAQMSGSVCAAQAQ